MNRLLLTLLMAVSATAGLTGCGGGSGAGAESTFSKSYGGPLHDEARVVLPADDGGFMLFGTAEGSDVAVSAVESRSPTAPRGGDFWVQKLDVNGNVEFSRMIGTRSPSTPGTVWKRARPTPDGGIVLTGYQSVTRSVPRPDGARQVVTTGRVLAVAKLDAGGNTLWRADHGSGAWLNYEYFEHNGQAAAARDTGEDVWPLADGGLLVVGTSVANLEDRLGLGFPCGDDAALSAVSSSCSRPPGGGGVGGGLRFLDAYSTVVMRLNADGSQRWSRRLTDDAFNQRMNHFNGWGLRARIRATADGGAVLARPMWSGALVHRLRADGTVRFRTVVPDFLHTTNTFGSRPDAADLVQTDDPVDGANADLHDGIADDGFVLAGGRRVIKLDADGALQWNEEIDLEGAVDGNFNLSIGGLTQHCDYGRPTRCDFVVVGSVSRQFSPTSAGITGFAAFLNQDGSLRAEVYPPRDASGSIEEFRRITGAGTGRFRLLGVRDSAPALIDLEAPWANPFFSNERHRGLNEPSVDGAFELRADGGVLVAAGNTSSFDPNIGRLLFYDARTVPLSEVELSSTPSEELLHSATQIGPGRYVLAGSRLGPGGQSGIVALRYDLDAAAGHVVWQRRIVADAEGDVLVAVPSGDGGVVLSLLIENPDRARSGRIGLLLALDADGRRNWQAALPGAAPRLQRLPDGGFAALSFEGHGATVLSGDEATRVTRLSAAGERLWQRSVSLGPWLAQGRVEAMTATADGGLVLAGSNGSRISLVRLAPDGSLAAATDLDMPTGLANAGWFTDERIRQAPDGGFVLAMTENGLVAGIDRAGEGFPLGQNNVLVLKVNAALQPQWSHIYGARFHEGVRDLAVRADGVIVVAGFSDSLGERREAWLLKLSPQGLISEGGCQALLSTFAGGAIRATARAIVTVAASATSEPPLQELRPFDDIETRTYDPQDHATARQCVGDVGAVPTLPGPSWRLSVEQVGLRRGVVTSEPAGISCGTGLDICAANFAQGSRVMLRADPTGFVAWRSACDEGTGGTSLSCAVALTGEHTVQVEFGAATPAPPTLFNLAFAVQGNGFVRTADGINCTEGSAEAACAREFAADAIVDVGAVASDGQVFLGWSGETAASICQSFGRQTQIRITVDRHLRCFAQFGAAEQRLVTLAVSGAGVVRDEPAGGAFDCREGGGQAACQEIYTATQTLTLRATPDAGQRFAGWGDDCASSGLNPSITLLTAQGFTCSAGFVSLATSATLTAQIVNGAAGRSVESQPTGINCSSGAESDCAEPYAVGTAVTLRATLEGFQGWQGCDAVQDINFCTVTMSQSRSVTASYAP